MFSLGEERIYEEGAYRRQTFQAVSDAKVAAVVVDMSELMISAYASELGMLTERGRFRKAT